MGFESQSKNRGRAEKSRLKKESLSEKKNDYIVIGKNRKGKPIKVTKDKTKKYGIGGVVMTKSQYKKRPDYDKKRIKGVDHILTKVGKQSVYLPIVFESVNEAVSAKGWNMSKKFITILDR